MPTVLPIANDNAESTRYRREPVIMHGMMVLCCALTNNAVTVTNRDVGTVHIRLGAYKQFRQIAEERGLIVRAHDKRTDTIAELALTFGLARLIRATDRNGNAILIDKEEMFMFIVDRDTNMLLAVFDKQETADAA